MSKNASDSAAESEEDIDVLTDKIHDLESKNRSLVDRLEQLEALIDGNDSNSISRRAAIGTIAGLGGLGVGALGASEPATAQEEHDHIGETWTGSTGQGLWINETSTGSRSLGIVSKIDSAADHSSALFGEALAGSGNVHGVEGVISSASQNSTALLGRATAGSGVTMGVLGRNASPQGRGLVGHAHSNVGNTIGLAGLVDSPDGTGIRGRNTASSGFTIGVEGATDSPEGYGLYTPDDAKVDGTTELATLAGSLTGGANVDTLAGDNLSISGGQLNASASGSGSSLWNDDDDNDVIEPNSGFTGINVPSGSVDNDFQVNGNLQVSGTKEFVQAVDSSTGPMHVSYTAVEAGRARTEVDDVADMEDGHAVIDLPEHFGMVTSEEEDLVVQVTPYAKESVQPQVTHRSTEKIIVEDTGDGPKDYAFAYTVKGVRAGFEDKEVLKDGPLFGED